MKIPLILCTGVLRSGSTWSFNVCRLMAQAVASKNDLPFWSGYLTLEQCEEFLQSNGGAVPGVTVIKAHGIGPNSQRIIKRGMAKAVCTYRDPRDCVASMLTFAGEPFDVALERVRAGLQMLDVYTRRGQTLFIRYEDMIADRMAQIRKIAAHLEFVFDERTLQRIDELTGIEHSKEICKQLQAQPQVEHYNAMNHRIDPQTWLHDNHIQSGKAGRWKDEMSHEQAEVLEKAYFSWLDRLGYLECDAAPSQNTGAGAQSTYI